MRNSKLFISRSLNMYECVQLLGGYGYIRDYEVERMYRDAKITEKFTKASEVKKMVIAGKVLR